MSQYVSYAPMNNSQSGSYSNVQRSRVGSQCQKRPNPYAVDQRPHAGYSTQRPMSPQRSVAQRPMSPQRSVAQRPMSPQRSVAQRPMSQQGYVAQRPMSQQGYVAQRPMSPQRSVTQRQMSQQGYVAQRPMSGYGGQGVTYSAPSYGTRSQYVGSQNNRSRSSTGYYAQGSYGQ